MPIDVPSFVAPVGSAVAALASAAAALRAVAVSRRTAAAAQAQAEAAREQAAASTQQAIAAQEHSRARSAEIDLARARLRRELAPDARALFDVGLQPRALLTDAWFQGPGAVDEAAQHRIKPSAQPDVPACVAFYRNMLQTRRADFALFLGVDSDEWADLGIESA